jgi:hypothetical protein
MPLSPSTFAKVIHSGRATSEGRARLQGAFYRQPQGHSQLGIRDRESEFADARRWA